MRVAQFDIEMLRGYLQHVGSRLPGASAVMVEAGTAIHFAAVAEYMSAEILELSGNSARDRESDQISHDDLMKAVTHDDELVGSRTSRT